MSDKIYQIRIKKQYAVALIEALKKLDAIEVIAEEETVELTDQQQSALDKELAAITTSRGYTFRWHNIKHQFKKP